MCVSSFYDKCEAHVRQLFRVVTDYFNKFTVRQGLGPTSGDRKETTRRKISACVEVGKLSKSEGYERSGGAFDVL